jgi:hypothetical protein
LCTKILKKKEEKSKKNRFQQLIIMKEKYIDEEEEAKIKFRKYIKNFIDASIEKLAIF